ncbi:MAG: helix-turn-helix transcriptional regulator [Planctomycetes bacterium]|nr:helix-turn-helix transcriptional regulator [Planctomycetota bacterium]
MSDARSTNGFGRPLTRMQRQVVRLCALGCTVREIALILDLSPSTIDNHKARAMAKAQVTNLAMLTRFAIQEGISPIGDALTAEERAKLEGALGPKVAPND